MDRQIRGFAGRVVTPADEAYEEARRVWNGAVDRHPLLIAYCTGPADVAAALRHARGAGIPVSVRGGGHGVSGAAVVDGGVVIDLSPLKDIEVDPGARTVRAGGGVLWGELDAATQAYGLATTGGIVSHTGIAGLTLGGGIGWLMRKHGLTVDNLLSAEVVTVDGEVVMASATAEPDLFWALRGGGGNFGVVTAFEYRLHPVGPTVLGGPVIWDMADAPDVLRHYRDAVSGAPDELGTVVHLRKILPLPVFPPEIHGRPACLVMCCWCGDVAAGAEVLAPLRRFGTPLADLVAERPYVAMQSLIDPAVPHGQHTYWKSMELDDLSDAAVEVIGQHSQRVESPLSYSVMFHLGGAVARVPEDATAVPRRGGRHNLNINGTWRAGEAIAASEIAWTRRFFEAMAPYQSGVYVNFLGDEGDERVRSAYGPAKYGRLAELKARYDPENVLRSNQNIPPAQPQRKGAAYGTGNLSRHERVSQ